MTRMAEQTRDLSTAPFPEDGGVDGDLEPFTAGLRPPPIHLLTDDAAMVAGRAVAEFSPGLCVPGWGYALAEERLERVRGVRHYASSGIDGQPSLTYQDSTRVGLSVATGCASSTGTWKRR